MVCCEVCLVCCVVCAWCVAGYGCAWCVVCGVQLVHTRRRHQNTKFCCSRYNTKQSVTQEAMRMASVSNINDGILLCPSANKKTSILP